MSKVPDRGHRAHVYLQLTVDLSSVRASSTPLHSHFQGLSGGKPNSEE